MKKIATGVISLTLALSLLAGCGSGATETGATTTPDANAPKPELRMLGFQKTNFDPNTDPVGKFLEEKTGYKVKYETLPIENPDDKLNLLIANKEPYDILKLSASQYTRLASQGALEPLDDLLKTYGSNITTANPPEVFDNAKIDGKIYGIPEKHPKAFVGQVMAVRQELLDELKVGVPTTIDEFYNLLKLIKEKKNIIPLTGSSTPSMNYEIAGAFGISAPFDDETGKIRHRLEDPGMKEYLAFMNKLYKEGLIDSEWPVNKAATAKEKFTSGKAAIYETDFASPPSLVAALNKTFPNTKLALIPSLKGKDGKQENWLQGGGISWYIGIPKSSKNKEAAMQYINMKLQPEIFKELAIGQEGTHWKKDEKGAMSPILPKFTEDRNNSDWFMTSTDSKNFGDMWLVRVRKDPLVGSTFEEIQKQASYSKQDPTLLAPPMDVVANNLQKLTKMETDYMIKAFAGAEDLANYDKFVQQFMSQGGSEVLKAYNDWYATAKKK
ncbi:extracellular solute-binding protein [Paenibacillus sp. FJAT-26967]|uniref:extracellular solute-binding protein n=1 Tax=Paenibacillus sp. FJAT-26967 TaxID=1729690 RepID=UPI000837BBEE|nr:extracellular solute-binding protein [Paenibacillus sp. FJAT-26967]